ncbi:MAG: glucose 1-dehydrogenase [Actinobacteria bacterium]|uniref:Unannotated protein n=1 Tax=freshwater metagenome TaxID=449393 RepID=A0A6J7TEF7_9ZZZZ|nr:glucose 1-dehydrogenase [Actinomycetota bacterium]MSY27970.1 glucose 1-dehydrogenase [Actinomycetota bacterium]MSZ87202.1 glucose 1-dehydrogenase [Actinomycetota bacterium]MTB14441.1 glucose 1-dehydrogenase [Actinomycetota bacterium]MTB25622.1 glucose 1-dehydrogenase [Actinomycetota bacterium]
MTESTIQSHRLEGKVAIITGASRGIGLAIAQRFVAEGARIIITARKVEPLMKAAEQFPKGTVLAIAGKADDPVHRQEVLDRVAQEFGKLDILINNAGINPVYGQTIDVDLDAARKIIEVNVIGTLSWIQAAYHDERLGFSKSGNVVNISSSTGDMPLPGIGFYGVSKAAISHLTRTLAVELGPNLRVNAIAPAVIATDFSKALYEGNEEAVISRYPMKRLGLSEDVASLVAFLASSDSSWITGQVMTLDGGLLIAGGLA